LIFSLLHRLAKETRSESEKRVSEIAFDLSFWQEKTSHLARMAQ
jgi:hypothetical protein